VGQLIYQKLGRRSSSNKKSRVKRQRRGNTSWSIRTMRSDISEMGFSIFCK
jgi:hypothetical protein